MSISSALPTIVAVTAGPVTCTRLVADSGAEFNIARVRQKIERRPPAAHCLAAAPVSVAPATGASLTAVTVTLTVPVASVPPEPSSTV